jgi:SpoVK/Ycf46/Vps4 family AAA+-type ATPase
MNPTKINNYNNFLITIDNNTSIPVNTQPTSTSTPTPTPISNDVITTCQTLEEFVNSLIQKNDNVFNKLNTPNFTGQNCKDAILAYLPNNNPNLYSDDKEVSYKKNNFYKTHLNKKYDKIHHVSSDAVDVIIDTEINKIDDILALIEQHKLDPKIKYNINMVALHNIKEPLTELNNMIGMADLKNNIVNQILYFVQELHKSTDPNSGDFMHTVIYGPPGTGKTEVAKILGKIYSKIGILNKGTFKKVTRGDLISGYLGQTALKTKDVIKECLGGVLFIDEAYALGNDEKKDSFSKECIDTLCEALSDHKHNLMVIIAGYESELNDCFFSYNQGLDSRFTWRFSSDEYTACDLHKIFLKKVKDIGWNISENSNIKVEWFKKNIAYFKFYGRDMETLLAKTKIVHSKRVFCKPENEKKKITFEDLDKGFELYLKNDNVKNRQKNNKYHQHIYI